MAASHHYSKVHLVNIICLYILTQVTSVSKYIVLYIFQVWCIEAVVDDAFDLLSQQQLYYCRVHYHTQLFQLCLNSFTLDFQILQNTFFVIFDLIMLFHQHDFPLSCSLLFFRFHSFTLSFFPYIPHIHISLTFIYRK